MKCYRKFETTTMKSYSYLFLFCLAAFGISNAYSGPAFDKFNSSKREKLESFGKQNLNSYSGHVFYPFGGPDVTFPLLMFPNLSTLTLVGLEPTEVPKSTIPELDNAAWRNLADLYNRSFFITEQMASGLKNNVAVLILQQLVNLGATEISVSAIEGKDNAVQIECSYNGKKRTIRYYKASLDNKQIDQQFLESLKPINVVMFKAASYLPHKDNFSKFQDFIFKNVEVIVQDSTGIPFRKLKNNNWDITLHGQYEEPYKFPGADKQTDYRDYSRSLNNQKLEFAFGYGFPYVPSNVLVAKKVSL